MTEGGLHWSRWIAAGLIGTTLVAAVVGIGIPALIEEVGEQKEALDTWLNSYPPEFAQTLGGLMAVASVCLVALLVTWPRRRVDGERDGSGI